MLKDLNLSWLIRYGYGGALLYLILLIAYPTETKQYTDAAGVVLAPLLTVAAGACIYVIYRHLFGEWGLYPVAHCFDYWTHAGNRGTDPVSTIWWLASKEVPKHARREAYTALRREYLQGSTRTGLDLAHSEVHVLYITFLELFVLGAYLLWEQNQLALAIILLVGGGFFLLAAWAADVRLHRHEFRSIIPADTTGRSKVEEFLRERGYIK